MHHSGRHMLLGSSSMHVRNDYPSLRNHKRETTCTSQGASGLRLMLTVLYRRRCVHVTNYSVNKHQPGFKANIDADCDGVGSKWSLRALQEHLEMHCGVQWHRIWTQVNTHIHPCRYRYTVIHVYVYVQSCMQYGSDSVSSRTHVSVFKMSHMSSSSQHRGVTT